MSDDKSKFIKFSWLRGLFWPVTSSESNKVIVMILMLALALFNYTCLRINKDALILTAYGSSKGGVLSFLKFCFVLPSTLFFVKKFWDLSNNVSKKNLFYYTLAPFLTFFVIFSLFIYPFVGHLHASPATIDAWQNAYPRFCYVFAVLGNWAFALFYVCAELWGNVVISLLFWNFANAAFKDNSKRLFPVFAAYSNIGLIAGGLVTRHFTLEAICAKKLGIGRSDSTAIVLACVVISGLLFAFLYWYLNEKILAKEGFDINLTNVPLKKEKPSFKESLHMLLTSKYLMYVTILVLSYGMTANLVEVTWKENLVRASYPNLDDYKIFFCKFFVWTGICTFLIGFFCKGLVGRFGWLFGSLITPIVMLITSVIFYVFILFGQYVLPVAILAHSVMYATIIGAIQNVLTKGSKYTLFDPTVQMSYQPLDEEQKVKGKAAVDVIGGRAGKSLGGVLQMIVNSLILMPYYRQFVFMVLVVGLCVAWIYASIALSKEYNALTINSKTDFKGVKENGK